MTIQEELNAYKMLLTEGLEHGVHHPECQAYSDEYLEADDFLAGCNCWMVLARNLLEQPPATVDPVDHFSKHSGSDCTCKHTAGNHAAGGRGLCTQNGCECLKFNQKEKAA